jgi:hypothetical protein
VRARGSSPAVCGTGVPRLLAWRRHVQPQRCSGAAGHRHGAQARRCSGVSTTSPTPVRGRTRAARPHRTGRPARERLEHLAWARAPGDRTADPAGRSSADTSHGDRASGGKDAARQGWRGNPRGVGRETALGGPPAVRKDACSMGGAGQAPGEAHRTGALAAAATGVVRVGNPSRHNL